VLNADQSSHESMVNVGILSLINLKLTPLEVCGIYLVVYVNYTSL